MAPGIQENEEAGGLGGEIVPSSVIKETEEVVSVENGVSENQLTEERGIKETGEVVNVLNGMAIENQLTVKLGSCIGGETTVASVNEMNAEEQAVDGEVGGSSANQETGVVVGTHGENGVASVEQVTGELGDFYAETLVVFDNRVNGEKGCVAGEIEVASADRTSDEPGSIGGETGEARGFGGEIELPSTNQVTVETKGIESEIEVASDNHVTEEANEATSANEIGEAGCVVGVSSMGKLMSEEAEGIDGEIGMASANDVIWETKRVGGEIKVASMNNVTEESGVAYVNQVDGDAEGNENENGAASANQVARRAIGVGGGSEVPFASLVNGVAEGDNGKIRVAFVNDMTGNAVGDGGEIGVASVNDMTENAVRIGGEIGVASVNDMTENAVGDAGEIGVPSVNEMAGNAVGDGGEIGICSVNEMTGNAVGDGGESRVPSDNQVNGVTEGISGGIGVTSANQVDEESLRGGGETGMLSSSQVNRISEGVGGEIKAPLANQVNREAGCVRDEFGVVEKHKWVETNVYRRRPKGEKNKGVLRVVTAIPATTTLIDDASRRQIEKLHLSQVNTRESNTIDEGNHNDNHLEVNGVTEGDKIITVLSSGNITNTSQIQPDTIVDVVSNTVLSAAGIDCVTPIPITPLVTNGALNPLLSASDGKVKVNLSSTAKLDLRHLKRKFENELNSVRKALKKMDGGREDIVPEIYHSVVNCNLVLNGARSNGFATRAYSGTESLGHVPYKPNIRPFNQLRVSVVENSHGMVDSIEREKRTPKANQFYRNTEFLLANDKFPPVESNKKSKSNGQRSSGGEFGFGVGSKVYKSCSALLEKLMKHKHGWVFNAPVDVKALGLHDYFVFVKNPMDLGTVKARLIKYWYKSPMEFAEDVRLTFHNAMLYNPKGHDVHIMAETLLKIFEGKWPDIEVKYLRQLRSAVDHDMGFPTPTSRITNPFQSQAVPPLETRVFSRSESMSHPINPKPRTLTPAPSFKAPALQKPKAKDVNKREMTYGEKQKLSTNLQGLPPEKLDGVIQIIKKRSTALSQNDDEIEVDIDSVDTETLWELDRYVSNYKKSLSKNRRKAELANQMRAEARLAAEKTTATQLVPPRESTTGYENATLPPPARPNNPDANASGSSTSSSSSSSGSSSSDSDSESSSEESGGHSPGT